MSSTIHDKGRIIDPYLRSEYNKKFDSKRIKFSQAEDNRLLEQVKIYGPKKWNTIAKALPGRTSRQCRDRFMNYLNGSLVNGPWTTQEDDLLIQKYNECGPQWTVIKRYFMGRSSNNVKNRWYTHLSKKVQPSQETTISKIENVIVQSNINLPEKKFPPLLPENDSFLNIDIFLNKINQSFDFFNRSKPINF